MKFVPCDNPGSQAAPKGHEFRECLSREGIYRVLDPEGEDWVREMTLVVISDDLDINSGGFLVSGGFVRFICEANHRQLDQLSAFLWSPVDVQLTLGFLPNKA